MSGALLRAMLLLVPDAAPVVWSAAAFVRTRTLWRAVQLVGATCLVLVALAHIAEALDLFPDMRWGAPDSAGNYLDLASAISGVSLLPAGYLGARRCD